MVRGVAAALTAIIVMSIVILAIGPVVEGVGEQVKDYDEIDQGELEGTSWINSTYDALFIWMPLIVVGGTILGAVAYYWRREPARRVR